MPTNAVTPPPKPKGILFERVSMSRWQALLGFAATAVSAGIAGYLIHDAHPTRTLPPSQTRPAAQQDSSVTRLPVRTFGHWNLSCVLDAQKVKRCEMVLRVVDRTTRKLLLSFAVARGADSKPVFLVVTPPNALLPQGVRLTMAGTEDKIGFVNCGPGFCRAGTPLTDSLRTTLASSASVQVRYTTSAAREVKYDLPNDGFSDALAALEAE